MQRPPTPPEPPRGWFQTRVHRLQQWRARHELAEIIVVFIAGFAFDVSTLSRVDDLQVIVQQGVYLLMLGSLLALEQRQQLGGPLPKWVAKLAQFAEAGIHFFLGSLISTFALNYFKSGSGITALAFVGVVFFLLVANEFPWFRRFGPTVRFALLSFCLLSFFAYLIPVIVGQVRPWMFVTAAVVSSALLAGLFSRLLRWTPKKATVVRQTILPGLVVQGVLVALYFLKVIPPVPLALTFIGVYHDVEAPVRPLAVKQAVPAPKGSKSAPEERFVTSGKYRLLHERPWWRFWQQGDQEFFSRDGDQIYCFFSIFAPNRFRDQVNIIWSRLDERKNEWRVWEAAPLMLGAGGVMRDAGWRMFRVKSKYEPGEWRVEAQTSDGRAIGGIGFTVIKDTRTEPRVYQMDLR